jgi:cystathionine beta-lyase
MKFGTKLVQFDPAPNDPTNPMVTPIYQTATFEQDHADSFGPYDYSRSGNPTRRVLEDQMAVLEGGTRGFAFSSGMAAITCVTHLLKPGDEILADWDLYGGTSRLFGKILNRAGIKVIFADASNPESFAAAVTAATKMLYVETPTNPLLRVIDLKAIAIIAKTHGVLFAVDSSAMSPYLQQPIALGADIVIHSATKYLCGHSDVTGGIVVAANDALAVEIAFLQNAEGSALGPFDCFLLLRGLKTLKLRLDAQQKNAAAVVNYLKTCPALTAVSFPGDPDHAGYALQQQQASGPGALLTVRAGTRASAKALAESLQLFKIAVSFGSVTSTVSIPAAMSHASVPEEHRATRNIPDDLLRLSIGIEDTQDLIDDLAQAIARL